MSKVTLLALPSMGSFVMGYLQNIVIGLCIGALHDAELLASVGLGSLVSNLLGYSIGIGLLAVLDSLVAQSAGSKNSKIATLQLARGRLVIFAISIPCTLVMLVSGKLLLLAGQDPIASAHSQLFVTSTAIGLLPCFLFTADSAFLRGYHVNTPILIVNILSSIFQAVSCIAMVNFRGMGLWGAGLSISIAHWMRWIFLQAYMHLADHSAHPETAEACGWRPFLKSSAEALDAKTLIDFTILALPSAALMWCEWWVYELQALIAGWLGISALAAHVVCCNVEIMAYMIPLGVQQATAVLVGNSLGAGRPRMAIQYSQLSVLLGLILAMSVCSLIVLYRADLAFIYSIDPEVLLLLDETLKIVAAYHILAATNCVLEGVLRGMRLQSEAVSMKIAAMVLYQLPAAYLISSWLGLSGIWYAAVSGLIFTIAGYGLILFRANIQECSVLVMKENFEVLVL